MPITHDDPLRILVTGASSGIGRALALAVSRRGARVGLAARRSELLAEVAEECRRAGGEALALPCDVTERASFAGAVDAFVARFGAIDVLVNNAGRGHNAYVEETPDEQIESIFRVNVFSLWYGTTAALRHMRAAGRGHIVNVSSIAGKIGYPGNAAYVAAKHAVVGFSRALRTELAETGIDVTTVIPAGVATDWAAVAEGGSMLELFAYERARGLEIAHERGIDTPDPLPLLSPDEVAEAITRAIEHPVDELYTHPGLRDFIARAESDPEAFAREQTPFWIANRERRMTNRGNG
jgi:NAD(P)-dependent dehydrogenase (short-subunit alcohol dehydrogenase family)